MKNNEGYLEPYNEIDFKSHYDVAHERNSKQRRKTKLPHYNYRR
jgi:hypothetical protein